MINKRVTEVSISIVVGIVLSALLLGLLVTGQTSATPAGVTCNVPFEYSTIQAAVDAVACTDIVLAGDAFVETVVIGRSVSIQGQGEQETNVVPDGSESIFAIEPGAVVTLTAMTIANGDYFTHYGGGVHVDHGTLHLKNVTLKDNLAHHAGGGIYNLGGFVHIDESQLVGNFDCDGAGVFNLGGEVVIENSLLEDNWGFGVNGGAIHTTGGGSVSISHSTFIANKVSASLHFGGALYNDGSTVHIESSTFLSNTADQQGGALFNESGTINISNSAFSHNSANTGGAISNADLMTLSDAQFNDNEAGNFGAAVFNRGTLSVEGTEFSNHFADGGGGAIANWGDLEVANSTFTANTASYGAGAVHNEKWVSDSPAQAVVKDSLFEQNDGTIRNTGGAVLTVDGSTFRDNFGAVFANSTDSGNGYGFVTIKNSAIVDNVERAVSNTGVITIENSTISGNQDGGVSSGYGKAHISGSTLANNSSDQPGGGVRTSSGIVEMVNSIVAHNGLDGDCWSSTENLIHSLGHNLDSDGSCNLMHAGDLAGADPLLGPLHTFNTLIQYRPLLPGSPAIDAGDDAACLDRDQRGAPRPFDGDGSGSAQCDIGAYEHNDSYPLANFTAVPTISPQLEDIVFTNLSNGDYASSLWDFGDGISSTLPGPTHAYLETGSYTIKLTIEGQDGRDSLEFKDFIFIFTQQTNLPVIFKRNQ